MDVYTDQSSTIYNMLPTLVKRRIPRLPSLRRSVSFTAKSTSVYGLPSSSSDSRSVTPPPSYRSRNTSQSNLSDFTTLSMSIKEQVPSRPSSSSSGDTLFSRLDESSGVNWKYAEQGWNLLNNSRLESFSAERRSAEFTAILSRQQYVHAATYILRGLPEDLSTEEKMGIETALPREVRESVASSTNQLQLLKSGSQGSSTKGDTQVERSILHRIVAYMVLRFFLILNLLLPYITVCLGRVYHYERKHRVSERMFSASISGIDMVGKRSMELSHTVYGLNDGKVGESINELLVWWIRGVTGGIHEGVGEGLNIVSQRKIGQPDMHTQGSDRVQEI
ncbi:hypothetical protein NA57DRAFT_75133 [Rhizodiscina lignyota]|uniref:Uncharacterized protein n=1 Tax=Rhizodiscina lignyota TaxID=1504668 RepID=A0A9P4IK49_9PEZI|nr:hypothetical protein NA57DRAFT_75133 [Rhizodiscina lignyota]